MSTHTDFVARLDKWCKTTGLKKSRARFNKVLPWFDKYSYPIEFDHARVFYFPPRKLYVLMVEPYEATPGSAAKKATAMSKGMGFSMVECPPGVGLWFPGPCRCTLIARAGEPVVLADFAQHLPSV